MDKTDFKSKMEITDSRYQFLGYLYDHKVFSYPGIDFRLVCAELGLNADDFGDEAIPYLEHFNYVDGPIGGKCYLTISGIDEVEQHREDVPETARIRRLRHSFLKKLDIQGSKYCNRYSIGKELNIDPDTVDFIVYYLKGKGYVEGGGPMGPVIKITMAGRFILENGSPL
jgi:hypothetical protein